MNVLRVPGCKEMASISPARRAAVNAHASSGLRAERPLSPAARNPPEETAIGVPTAAPVVRGQAPRRGGAMGGAGPIRERRALHVSRVDPRTALASAVAHRAGRAHATRRAATQA